MIKVSLCMIVKNEEKTLPRCLDSVRDMVDEIIIVDTGSTDGTREVAADYTDKIYDFTWIDDFSAARNYSYSKATCDYVMWLDADDVVLPPDAEAFCRLKQTLPTDARTVMLRYNVGFDPAGRLTFSYYRERLTLRAANFVWREPVHEYLETVGARTTVDISITHMKPPERPSRRNLDIYEAHIAAGEQPSPRGMFYYARELRDHARHADAVTWFETFLESNRGWVEDNITACADLSGCYAQLGRQADALTALLRSFAYAPPRPEICCKIGAIFQQRREWHSAIFWYETALRPTHAGDGIGFHNPDCSGYIPCLELAVCHDALGDHATGNAYNERAAAYHPDSVAVTQNRSYFAERLQQRDA